MASVPLGSYRPPPGYPAPSAKKDTRIFVSDGTRVTFTVLMTILLIFTIYGMDAGWSKYSDQGLGWFSFIMFLVLLYLIVGWGIQNKMNPIPKGII